MDNNVGSKETEVALSGSGELLEGLAKEIAAHKEHFIDDHEYTFPMTIDKIVSRKAGGISSGATVGTIVVLIILNILDIVFTGVALHIGVCESNPLLSWITDLPSLLFALLMKLFICTVLLTLVRHFTSMTYTALLGAVGVYVWLTGYHIINILNIVGV